MPTQKSNESPNTSPKLCYANCTCRNRKINNLERFPLKTIYQIRKTEKLATSLFLYGESEKIGTGTNCLQNGKFQVRENLAKNEKTEKFGKKI